MKKKSLYRFFPALHFSPSQNDDVFYIYVDGRQAGPMSESELKFLIKNGSVSSNTLIWMPELKQWTQAQYIPVVNKLLLLTQKKEFPKSSNLPLNEINPFRSDIVNAIVGLGFKKHDAVIAIDKVLNSQPNVSLEKGIREVLRILQ